MINCKTSTSATFSLYQKSHKRKRGKLHLIFYEMKLIKFILHINDDDIFQKIDYFIFEDLI